MRDTEARRYDEGNCAEPVKAWHDKRGEKSLRCARRAVNNGYCAQHAKRHDQDELREAADFPALLDEAYKHAKREGDPQ